MADSNGIVLRYAQETDFGVPPTGQYKTARVTSVSVDPEFMTAQSEEILPTLRERQSVRTTERAMLSIGIELSAETLRDWWAAMLLSAWLPDTPSAGRERVIDGNTPYSQTMAVLFTDVDLALWVNGAIASGLSLQIGREGVVSGTFDVMGLSIDGGPTPPGTGPHLARTITRPMQGMRDLEVLEEGGAGIRYVESLSIQLQRELEPKYELGTSVPFEIRRGTLSVTGEIQSHLRSLALFDKAKDFVDSELRAMFRDAAGNTVELDFPRIEYSNFSVQVGGRDADVFGTAPWRAVAADDVTPVIRVTEWNEPIPTPTPTP